MIPIRKGDVFVVRGSGVIPAMIRWAEIVWSKDNKAEYNHAGIIVDSEWTTLEALWSVREGNLSKYLGREIAIYRPKFSIENESGDSLKITKSAIDLAINKIREDHEGDWYPIHRLFLHLMWPMAKLSWAGKFVVCSELVAKYLWLLGARDENFPGTSPDILSDEWRHWKNMKRVFRGEFG